MGRRIVRTSSQDLKKLLLNPTGGRFMRPLDGFDQVYPGILLGDAETALSTHLLKELKVTHVLNAAHGKNDDFYGGYVNTSFSNYDQAGIKFMGVPAMDSPSFYLRSYFKQAADFIEDCLKSGGKVLIHCQCGISRSATLIAAYLMLKKGMDCQEALSTIRAHRSIFPNQGFLSQLCDFEYEQKQEGRLTNKPRDPPKSPEPKPYTSKDPIYNSAFHKDSRPTFHNTNFWPLTKAVSRGGYPTVLWNYETESRSRARSEDRHLSLYANYRSSSPIDFKSSSVEPELQPYRIMPVEHSLSQDVAPSDMFTPYHRSYYYPDSYYNTRSYLDYYYTPRYSSRLYDSDPFVSPYHTRYYGRYYSPSLDTNYYRSPYLEAYNPYY